MVKSVPTEIFTGLSDDLKDFWNFRQAFNIWVWYYRAEAGRKVGLLLICEILVTEYQYKVISPGGFDFGDCGIAKWLRQIDVNNLGAHCAGNWLDRHMVVSFHDVAPFGMSGIR